MKKIVTLLVVAALMTVGAPMSFAAEATDTTNTHEVATDTVETGTTTPAALGAAVIPALLTGVLAITAVALAADNSSTTPTSHAE